MGYNYNQYRCSDSSVSDHGSLLYILTGNLSYRVLSICVVVLNRALTQVKISKLRNHYNSFALR